MRCSEHLLAVMNIVVEFYVTGHYYSLLYMYELDLWILSMLELLHNSSFSVAKIMMI